MQEHHITCTCGIPLTVILEENFFCKVYCEKCKKIIFVQQKGTGKATIPMSVVESNAQRATATATATADNDAQGATMAYGMEAAVATVITDEETKNATVITADEETRGATVITATMPIQAPVAAPKSAAPAKPAAQEIGAGTIVGKFEIVKELGQGGMGKVYLGRNTENQEQAVIKVLKMDSVPKGSQEKFTDYFLREMQVLRELNHPNIVAFKGCGNYQGFPFIAMEFIDGDSLEHEIKQNGPMKLGQAIPIIFYVADALEYAKNSGNLIHRDIKPANIMILKSNKKMPKVIDFGLAKAVGSAGNSISTTPNLTASGATMGTLFYMPPEQIGDAKHADHRADIYALGATFYHMLAGRAPFGEMGTTSAVMKAKMQKMPTLPLSQYRPDVPPAVSKIIDTAMAFAIEKRYPTMAQFKADLKKFIESLAK